MAKKKKTLIEPDRVLIAGKADLERCDNKVVSARYTALSFFPVAIMEQFRRFGNVYFLVMGGIMFVGEYTDLYDTAISPWTTLGPLAFVISISLLVEGLSDYKRHLNDHETNNAPVVILQNTNDLDEKSERDTTIGKGRDITVQVNGTTSKIAFTKVPRLDIRQGHLVVVKNREMVPADCVLLASSNDQGGAYIETSSIDGETNLKLRSSPHGLQSIPENSDEKHIETLDAATKRICSISYLGRPNGVTRPNGDTKSDENASYVATLTTEPPNASVHTFSGKLTIPDGTDIPLGAENALLRGAVIRNTEWIIGLAFFTGTDTKLVRNSFDTPSKFSQLDALINKTVLAILFIMILCIVYLASQAVHFSERSFDYLFYAGFNTNKSEPWPYLRQFDYDPPEWTTSTNSWLQYFFLYVTLLNNFIPLSLYVTVEMVQFFQVWLVNSDVEMYDDTTNTPAQARSTIVSDLGRIEYVFSDKTGTLTQNVMGFKRCSVDGMIFGSPIQRTRPEAEADLTSPFHPLRQLLVGRFSQGSTDYDSKLTFNSEMFLRTMSLCHTVVVEQDIDNKENISSGVSMVNTLKTPANGRNDEQTFQSPLESVNEETEIIMSSPPGREPVNTPLSLAPGDDPKNSKNADGAPIGYAYQAESPDEGALVSAASKLFGFQVVARDSSGIRLRVEFPSHLQDTALIAGLKNKTVKLDKFASETAHELLPDEEGAIEKSLESSITLNEPKEETWSILAVNKFDSDRKRMSILLRAPQDFGSFPILFCKGADSSMIDSEICGIPGMLDEDDGDDEMEHLLRMQMHLGEFAKEGLRTLVLGMRVLTEDECAAWLEKYKAAASSITNREERVKEAAIEIEKYMHIVGATAIEDKLQKNVPETIETMGKAGIKLWVLTGDKRETAVEIGYSTNVLTSKMHLTEVPDNGRDHVRTQMSMEFMRLIKIGRLRGYQMAAFDKTKRQPLKLKERISAWMTEFNFVVSKFLRYLKRSFLNLAAKLYSLVGMEQAAEDKDGEAIELEKAEGLILRDLDRRRFVRETADKTIRNWLNTDEGYMAKRASAVRGEDQDEIEIVLASEETPRVFVRALSAKGLLQDMYNAGDLSEPEIRQLSMAHLTAHQMGAADAGDSEKIVDEDTLSLESFIPGGIGDKADFDRRKRTLLERMFAVDRQVRKGRLRKHLTRDKLASIAEDGPSKPESAKKGDLANNRNASRALVIEGAALKHLLGDPVYEEILFAVASNCNAVIACRVSPRQKAQLVKVVRENIRPEPITLAIGDGANDVGMIQEAHVGIGISGKEGKQAVNASDFAIAQFRFLETLLLIHGRWNFFRLSTVVLFSFYKNAVMAGTIIVYTQRTLYSGTPLYDEWVMAMLNFVATFPIIFLGFFDRCLSKAYVRKHPEVYNATRENQLITVRSTFRWISVCFAHVFLLFYLTVPQQSFGGGMTSAFLGLMRNDDRDRPGDGEGSDLKSVGTVTYTCLIITLAYKVLFESRSLVHGRWPWFTFRKDVGEGFVHRLSYTWIGVTVLSIFFFLWAIAVYQLVGRKGASEFSGFTLTTNHVLGTRSMTWMLFLFVPIICMIVDVSAKVFSNMFYPTQTQIHLENEAMGKMLARRSRWAASARAPREIQPEQQETRIQTEV